MNPLSLCCSVAWVEKVNSAQVVSILLAGATFVPLAVLLGRLFAARGITARDAAGRLRGKSAALIAAAFAILVFAHALASYGLGWFHPAIGVFYLSSAAFALPAARAKPRHPAP